MTANLRGIGIVPPEVIPIYTPQPGALPTGVSSSPDVYGASWCGSGNPIIDWFCTEEAKKSTIEQIITSDSDYGSQLSAESRAAAEEMARELIRGDDPCNYSEINGMGWAGKLDCYIQGKIAFPLPDLMIPLLLIAGVILFATLKK